MKRRKFFAAASSLAVLAAALLTGCGDAPQAGSLPAGTLTLRVNPEIQIAYDEKGKVLSLTGENGDGKEIVAAYPDYIGKDCEVVVQELVEEIHEAGYFVEDIDGEKRQITIEIETGSRIPHDDFLDEVVDDVQECVNSHSWNSPAEPAGETRHAQPRYDDTDYGPNNDGVTDYADTDYGPNNDGVTDYADTDYGPNNDGVTDYADTDYGPNNDGVTDYADTDYGPNNDGVTDYSYTDYDDGDTNYDDGGDDTDYGDDDTDYGDDD